MGRQLVPPPAACARRPRPGTPPSSARRPGLVRTSPVNITQRVPTDSWTAASPALGLIRAGTDQLEAVCGALCPAPSACPTVPSWSDRGRERSWAAPARRVGAEPSTQRRAIAGPRPPVLFPSPKGLLRDPNNTSGDLRQALDRAGFPWAMSHTFRRTVATRLDAGSSARQIADHLGHSRPSLTRTSTSAAAPPTPYRGSPAAKPLIFLALRCPQPHAALLARLAASLTLRGTR